MKRETMETIDKFIEFMDVVNGGLNTWPTIKSLLLQLPELERTLAHGGLIQDKDGKWCKNGTRVKVYDLAIAKDSDIDTQSYTDGTLVFDVYNMSWVLKTSGKNSYYLGKGGDGVEFSKEEE